MIPEPRHSQSVTAWGGASLFAAEWGDPDGAPILFVHGWSQAHPAWARQLDGALDAFRLVAFDLRGHGASADAPLPGPAEFSRAMADDLAAVIDAFGLDAPVLVGWSMGGWIVQDYLRHHGDAAIAGFALVGTSATTGTYLPPEAAAARARDVAVVARGMTQPRSLGDEVAATADFVRACFHEAPAAPDLACMVGYNMLCRPATRRACRSRSEDYRPDLVKTSRPALIQWGAHERLALPPMIDQLRAALPHARAIRYAQSGHAPFWEEADAFNSDLRRFVKETT